MKQWFEDAEPALRWLRRQVAGGRGGYVLLAGFDAQGPRVAWAAGLRGEHDYPNFVTFARFALHRLHDCHAYWLMIPDEFGGRLGYRLELRSPQASWYGQALLAGNDQDEDRWELAAGAARPLMDDLCSPGQNLPGIMRRDLEQLSERLQIAPPDPAALLLQ
jgi:hypothetical protein